MSNKEDDASFEHVGFVLEAIKLVTSAPETEPSKTGILVCPKCGGELVYTRFYFSERKAGGRKKQSFAFQCRTKDCLSGSGH